MSSKIVAFSGKRGTGKTTAATYLKEQYGFKVVSFAGRLKEDAERDYPGISTAPKEKPFRSQSGKRYEWTPREYMINLGQFKRYYDPDFWVKASGLDNAVGKIAIDDLRFPNEAEYIRGLGGKIVRVNRYEYLNIYGKNLDDPSETALDDYKFDFTVESCFNVDMKDLFKQMDFMLRELGITR